MGAFACSENVARLQEFANRFTPRFTELMADVDVDVAAAALHLLAQLVQLKVLRHKVLLAIGVLQSLELSQAQAELADGACRMGLSFAD